MNRTTQTGSAHIIVIILLIIALFAALGVVFYQNFVIKKADNSRADTSSSVPLSTTKTARIAFNSTIYALDYPEKWTVKSDPLDNSGTSTTFTSPDQKVQAAFTISGGGVGGSCDVNDGLKVSYYKVYPEAVTKLSSQPLSMVETMFDAPGGGYYYGIGLTPDSGATHAAVGDTHCNVTQVGFAASLVTDGTKITSPTIIAKILFPKLTKEGAPVSEMQPVKELLATDDYKAAVKVLESARKE